jgi:hypothetical protein
LTKESFCGIMTIDIKKAVTERSRRGETAREMKP